MKFTPSHLIIFVNDGKLARGHVEKRMHGAPTRPQLLLVKFSGHLNSRTQVRYGQIPGYKKAMLQTFGCIS